MVAIGDRIACRVVARWREDGEIVRESFHVADSAAEEEGRERPDVSAAVLRVAAAAEPKSPDLAAVLSLAHARRLPTVYDPAEISFAFTTPIYLDHVGIEVGRVLVVQRDGSDFTGMGFVHPDHADAVRARGQISPGLWIEEGAIASRDGMDVLAVSRATLVELSAVSESARTGSSVVVSAPREVPALDWSALVFPDSAFAHFASDYDHRLDRMVFP